MRKPTAKSVEEVNIYLEGLGLGTADNGNLTRDGNLSVERTGGDVMLQVKTISSGNPYINISGASDQYITWQYSDVTKFAVRTTASDWRLYVADDAGSIWSGHTWVFGVNRSTGLITAKNGIAIGDAGPQMLSGALGPSGVQAPVGSTYRQTAANSSHGNLNGLLWNKVASGTTEGTDWLVDYEGRWVDWTPTITQTVAVSKTVTSARYTRQGKTATVEAFLSITSSGTAGGIIEVSDLPVSMARGRGVFRMFDSGVTNYVGQGSRYAATALRFNNDWNGNTFGQGGVQLTSGDFFEFQITCEIA